MSTMSTFFVVLNSDNFVEEIGSGYVTKTALTVAVSSSQYDQISAGLRTHKVFYDRTTETFRFSMIIDAEKTALLKALNSHFYTLIIAGFTHNGQDYNCTELDQINLSRLFMLKDSGIVLYYYNKNNVQITLNSQEVSDLFLAMQQHISSNYDYLKFIKNELAAVTDAAGILAFKERYSSNVS